MQKGQILIWVIVGALIIALAGGAYYFGYDHGWEKSISSQTSQTPQPTPSPSSTVDETANWKTYSGRYFSFKYPTTWSTAISTTDQSDIGGYSQVLEITNSRISPNAVFEVTYRNYSYAENVQQHADWKAEKLTVGGKEATRFQTDGSGETLPKGYSVITVVIKGSDNTSYSIIFNGDRKDITDSLIDQILSTFKFI